MPTKSDLIRSYFAAYKNHDRTVLEKGFSDNFTFTSPYDDAIDKQTYFERCWPNHERIREHDIERIFEQGDEAYMTYRIVTRAGDEFRNTEFFRFRGDKLLQVEVYFGASYRDGKFVKQGA
jgi:ketosteroid isomerase-like protein